MARQTGRSSYHQLAVRLNKFPQGAPPSDQLNKILKILFSEREANLVSRLPIRVFSAKKASRAWGLTMAETRKTLNDLCRKALLVDIEQNGCMHYCLPPPMAGFFEFSMMRARTDIDQKALAELLYQYINIEKDFSEALFAQGQTKLGRIFVNESEIDSDHQLEVLAYEKATQVIHSATHIGLSQCYCRHKMDHVGLACDAPQKICLTLNITAASLIRHGHAKAIDTSEAIQTLQRAHDHHLVQFGENVRQQVNFICNCCKCCCEGLQAAQRFAMYSPVLSSNFLPEVNSDKCSGCSQCVQACPVDAISLSNASDTGHVEVYTDICLGCGICSRVCPTSAIRLHPRANRTVTPVNTAQRVLHMAIERDRLQHIIFDNQVLFSHRAMAALLGALFRLGPAKRLLASRQLKSRYIETIIDRLQWQPANADESGRTANRQKGDRQDLTSD
jgi:Na+-translocating ferredoxin:NAD+ oxidoreductase RNF subunit RnfB